METLRFEDMNLSPRMLKAVADMGYIEPSPIQGMAIPLIMQGKDIIGMAQTGTGKTAAFGIPIIERLDYHRKEVQAAVLTPTRELAIQVAGEINKLGKHHTSLKVLPVYGGQSIDRQMRALRAGVHVVIGTPGRTLDLINRGELDLYGVNFTVLDEADEMLDMGFIDDITEILGYMENPARQTVLFSATIPDEVVGISRRFMKEPEVIRVVHQELTVPQVAQYFYEIRQSDKPELLTRLIDFYNPRLSMVFVNTKVGVEALKEKVHAAGYSVEALHGDMKQTQRDFVMKRFRNTDFEILIATDVAARGLDVDDVDMVLNYDLPQDEEYYVHRIGRTARAGREGMAVSFVTMKEFRKLRDIERFIKARIEKKPIPSMKDVEDVRNEAFLSSVKDCIEAGGLEKQITYLTDTLGDYSSVEIAAALYKMLTDRRNAENAPKEDISADEEDTVRFFLTAGKRDGITLRELVEWITGATGISGRHINNASLLEKFSFVNVPAEMMGDFMEGIANARLNGRKIKAEVANRK